MNNELNKKIKENLKKLNEALENGSLDNLRKQVAKNSVQVRGFWFEEITEMFPDFGAVPFDDTEENLKKLFPQKVFKDKSYGYMIRHENPKFAKSLYSKRSVKHPYGLYAGYDDWKNYCKTLTKTGNSFLVQEIQKLLNEKITQIMFDWGDTDSRGCDIEGFIIFTDLGHAYVEIIDEVREFRVYLVKEY